MIARTMTGSLSSRKIYCKRPIDCSLLDAIPAAP
jgi:hypothetical protein